MFTYSIYKPYSYVSICQWDSTPVKERMVAGCILEMESSYLKNPTQRLVLDDHQPKRECVVKPHEELTLAIQGERIWHEE